MEQKELNQLMALISSKLGDREPTQENIFNVYLNELSLSELAQISPIIRESISSIIDLKDLFDRDN